jgi:hypothetical protein
MGVFACGSNSRSMHVNWPKTLNLTGVRRNDFLESHFATCFQCVCWENGAAKRA